jgi:hypothetical protein
MATEALLHQVAAKWQESFNRINRKEPGISGLISFSKVSPPHGRSISYAILILPQAWQLLDNYLSPSEEPNRNSKQDFGSPLSLDFLGSYSLDSADAEEVRAALDIVNQSRRLPALLEVYLGLYIDINTLVSLLNILLLEQVRQKFWLVQNDIKNCMDEYQVRISEKVDYALADLVPTPRKLKMSQLLSRSSKKLRPGI